MNSSRNLVSALRDIVYEPAFEDDMKAIHADFFRVDEFIQGAEWVLARQPETGTRIEDGSNVWCLPVAPSRSFRPAMLFYTFNDRKVWMLSLRVLPQAEDV